MEKVSPTKKKQIQTETIVTIILLIIVVVAAIYVSIFYLFEEEPEIKLTSKYKIRPERFLKRGTKSLAHVSNES